MDKKQLSEADICAKFISPAVVQAGWSEVDQIYREYTIAPGRIVVRGLACGLPAVLPIWPASGGD